MRSTTATSLTTFLALLEFVSATYFTSPQSSTVWQSAPGQTITWHYQAGGAAVGDIVLQAQGLGGPGSTITVASQVDLTTESLTFPSDVALRSNTGQYELKIVNSQDPSFAYTTVGPFSIESFQGSAQPSSSSPSSSPDPSTSQGQSNESQGAPHTETNPPVSTPASTTAGQPLQTVTRGQNSPSSPSPSSSPTPSTTSTRLVPSSSSSSSTIEQTEISSTTAESTTTQSPMSTSTVLSTASVVAITSTYSDPSAGVRTATIISASRPSSTSGANSSKYGSSSWVVGGVAAVVAMGAGYLM
ncbi:hypothetical protein JCM16303_003325 [Sporobolomyces ruberrimus]